MGRHVMEALGLCRIVVEDGEIVEISQPRLHRCPMFAKMRGLESLTADSVRANIEFRMKDFGLFTEDRQVRGNDIVTFGVSEILSNAIRENNLDAACIVSDGCGSAIVTDPEILQGLCGRISGIIETSPIRKVLDAVGEENVLDPATTPIDQIRIAEKASLRPYKRFAVTVCRGEDAEIIRRTYGDRVVVVAAHTSGMCQKDVDRLFENCDIITACASSRIREKAFELLEEGKVKIAGNKVQIIAVTQIGQMFVGNKLRSLGRDFWNGEPATDDPVPFID